MTTIQPFAFEGREVRVQVDEQGEPWFCASDVCGVLEHSNASAALACLDDDEKGLRLVETPGGFQQMQHVTEAGLYRLTMRSDKPKAKPFQRWVTHDVLPAIRRTGIYVAPAEPSAALDVRTMAQLARSVLALTEQVEEKSQALAVAVQKIAADAPKVEAYQQFLEADGTMAITTAGKVIGVQPRLFHGWLERQGHIFRRGRDVLARQDHLGAGRMRQITVTYRVGAEETRETVETKFTTRGVAYFHERLASFRDECVHVRRAPRRRSLLALPEH